MHQPVFARQNRHKGTEVDNPCHFTRVNGANLCFRRNRHDDFNCGIPRGRILAKDLNGTVVIDIHRSTRVFSDLSNRRTTFTDDVPNLVLINL